MLSGSWGLWHDKVNAEDIKSMPIRFSEYRSDVTRRIVRAIDQLSTVDLQPGVEESIFGESLFSEKTLDNTDVGYPAPSLPEVLDSINTAVFDLFDLAPAERDLIDDFHTYTLDIAGNWRRSPGLETMRLPSLTAGTIRNVREVDSHPMREYLDRFLNEWNQALEPDGEFLWQVVGATNSELIGAVFETRDETAGESTARLSNWQTLLERLATSLSHPTTATLGTEGVLRSVSDTSIVVIKRREARLWSASAAREDVEATMLQAMMLQET